MSSRLPLIAAGTRELEDTLTQVWGYEEFRGEQKKVCQALCDGYDCAVFWATGAGKSICYQLPALHMRKVAVVISPLIALMQDQVTNLRNVTGKEKCATFLGSAQQDVQVEDDALSGCYSIVYVTPEKFSQDSFSERLARLWDTGSLAYIAVDEAHCVSEWGHDFRPDFRRVGDFRKKWCSQCPFIALTATAVQQVKSDVECALQLRANKILSVSSVDRPNLVIRAMQLDSLGSSASSRCAAIAKSYTDTAGSTVIYCATTSLVDDVADHLSQLLQRQQVRVAKYHAKLSLKERETSHIQFLTGEAPIIVATIAFGMGIDKPDIRHIWHFGPPKTFEEYYQQIGRAGRDGLTATCTMLHNASGFAKYGSDFYTNPSAAANAAATKSRQALEMFANDTTTCRRKAIVQYFSNGEETADFGSHCGKCDNCVNARKYSGDMERNFLPEALAVLLCLRGHRSLPMSRLLEAVIGSTNGKALKRTKEFWKEFVSILCKRGLVQQSTIKGQYSTYYAYKQTSTGMALLSSADNGKMSFMCEVPKAVRDGEREFHKRIQTLRDSGVDLSTIPQTELTNGGVGGPNLDAEENWIKLLARYREKGDIDREKNMKTLLQRIMTWREKQAVALRMAPAAVCTNALAKRLAYVMPTTVDGVRGVGLRVGALETLADTIEHALTEFGWRQASASDPSTATEDQEMIFAVGKWSKPGVAHRQVSATSSVAFEKSAARFQQGENIHAIAANPGVTKAGKAKAPVQVSTILSHLLRAAEMGIPIDLARLKANLEGNSTDLPPTQREWDQILSAVDESGVDVLDPTAPTKVLLEKVFPAGLKPKEEKTVEEDVMTKTWYAKIRWFCALRRLEYPIQFPSRPSQARTPATAHGHGGVQTAMYGSEVSSPPAGREKKRRVENECQAQATAADLLEGLDASDLGFEDDD
eukprot:m.874384 g.874384  ORF g.874384 m.874384 type:complete len:929 (-) comp23574_c0_seq5:426-3212(-)